MPALAILTLLFLPSYQLWSVSALRDASTVVCMVLAAWGLSLLVMHPTQTGRVLGVIAIFLGTAGIYMARSYLALMLSGALLLAIALPPYYKRKTAIVIRGVASVASNYVGNELRAFPPGQVPRALMASQVSPPSPSPEATQATPRPVLGVIDSRVSSLSGTREGIRAGAGSAYPRNYCESPTAAVATITCEALFLPIGIYRFLLTPNLVEAGLDIPPSVCWRGWKMSCGWLSSRAPSPQWWHVDRYLLG